MRAEQERKARRLTVMLGALGAAVIVATMGVLLWLEGREADLRADADGRVHAAQRRANELRLRAQEATADKATLWTEATAVAREAAQIARAPHVAPALLVDTDSLAADIEREAGAELRDQRVLELIEEIRPHQGEDRSRAEIDIEHEQLGALFGVDFDTDPIDRVADAIRQSALAPRIAASLHHWSHKLRGPKDAERRRRMMTLADHLDPVGWRTALRRMCTAHEADALRELANQPGIAEDAGSSLGMLGECLAAADNRKEAIRIYRLAHLHRPDDYSILHDLAVLLESEAKPPHEEITRLFTAAVALRPNDPHTLVDLATALLEKGESDAARVFVERARELEPEYPRAWIILGALRFTSGDPEGALEAYRELHRLQPKWLKSHQLLAGSLLRGGRMDEALDLTAGTVELFSESGPALRLRGNALMETGYLTEAIPTLRRAAELDDGDSGIRYDLGLALQRAGLNEESEASYRRAIELQPDFAEAHCNLGSVLEMRGRYAEAVASIRTGEAHGQRRARGWAYPTETWIVEIERKQSRLADFERVRAGEDLPDDSDALLDLARIAVAKGEPRLALRLFDHAYRNGARTGNEYLDAVRAAVHVATAEASATDEERAQAATLGPALLRAVLDTLEAQADQSVAGAVLARTTVESWLLMPELAPVREGTALPDEARDAWRQLLDDVRELRDSLRR